MRKPSLVLVVLEDERHRMLIRRYLKKCGLERQTRIQLSPSGSGSAENWVRRRFVIEIDTYRRRHAQTALIVVIDADTGSVQDRLAQLDKALKEAGNPIVDSTRERIARLVPRRNVETWICCLNGHAVDEETDYKNDFNEDEWIRLIPPAAEALFQCTRSDERLPMNCVDSLQSGIRELNHLRF